MCAVTEGETIAARAVIDDKIRLISKRTHLPVAEASGHAWRAVESAVRRTAKLAWKTDPEKVQVLAGYPLDHRPTAGQFLEMLYNAADTMYEKK